MSGAVVLGIETSCDETAAAVVRDGRIVLSSVVASQTDIHEEYAGVVPELASRAHVEQILPVVREALAAAGVGLGLIDAVAVGHRPGLIGSLLVGVSAAKALAWSLDKPLIGVDHVRAHLYSGVLTEDQSPQAFDEDALFPALGLIVSGGHTAVYRLRSWTQIERLGGTIDDAIGEAFDKAAVMLGLPFPGGPALDRLAQEPGADDRAVELPISRLGRESLDFSFSGLKTALLYQVKGVPNAREPVEPLPLTPKRKRDLAASFQRAAVEAVRIKLERAADGGGYKSLVTGGGVTANSRLRAELAAFAGAKGLKLLLPPMRYCMDNAAMIAGLGARQLAAGLVDDLTLQAEPTTSVAQAPSR